MRGQQLASTKRQSSKMKARSRATSKSGFSVIFSAMRKAHIKEFRNEEVCKDCQGRMKTGQGCGADLRFYMYFCVFNESLSMFKEE